LAGFCCGINLSLFFFSAPRTLGRENCLFWSGMFFFFFSFQSFFFEMGLKKSLFFASFRVSRMCQTGVRGEEGRRYFGPGLVAFQGSEGRSGDP